jgi:hypothetical protein
MYKLGECSSYFTKRFDATGRSSLTPLQKYIALMRLLAYGMTADIIDVYLKLVKTTARVSSIVRTSLIVTGLSSYIDSLSSILSVY